MQYGAIVKLYVLTQINTPNTLNTQTISPPKSLIIGLIIK